MNAYGDLNNSELEATDESVTEVARVECNLTIYPVGTVVIAMYGGFNQIGRTGLLTVPATVNQALSAVCPDAKRIDSKYLIHYLNFFVDRWKDIASSSRKDPNITRKDVSTFQIALPPLAEQRAIAAVLGDLDGLIAASGRGIAKRRDLKQAAMQQLLTGRTRLPGFADPWATRKLGDCLEPLQSGVSVRSVGGSDGERQAGPRILKTSAVSDGDFDESETKPIAPEDLGRARLCPKADTILMSRMNTVDLVGECGYVPRDIADVFIPDRLWRIEKRSDAQLDMKWLTAMLAHSHLKGRLKDAASGTSGSMKNIAQSALLNIQIDLPPLAEQRAIAAVLADFDAELAALEAERAKWRLVKQGAMQELLTGRTRLV